MKTVELRKKKDNELYKLLREKRNEIRELRFSGTGTSNVHASRNLRRDIARIMTELRSRTA